MINKTILMGRLTRSVEGRTTSDGTYVGNFGLALNRKRKGAEDEVVFVDCTVWGKRGEAFARYHEKGDVACFEGRLSFDQWTDRDGTKRTKLFVTVEDWTFVPGRKEAPF